MTAALQPPSVDSRHIQYLRVIFLGLSAFVFNTTEFVPVGLLSDIAHDFSVTTSHAGWMLTIYAWIVASMSLPMMLLTRKIERKRLLLVTFSVFILSHVLSVVAWRFEILVLSRVGIAFAHAIFWSITASIAIRVAPPGKKTFALGVLSTGTSLAMVLGVPIGRIVGQLFSWHITFVLIAIVALCVMLVLWRLLPAMPSLFTGSLSKVPELLKTTPLAALYLFVFIVFTAHYTFYSYIEPFMINVGQMSNSFTTVILLLFGGAGIIGSMVYSYLGDKYSSRLMISSTAIMLGMMAIVLQATTSPFILIGTVLVWGGALTVLLLTVQGKVLGVDSSASDIVMSMFSGIINFGVGAGALIGGQSLRFLPLQNLGYMGAVIGGIGLGLIIYFLRRYPSIR